MILKLKDGTELTYTKSDSIFSQIISEITLCATFQVLDKVEAFRSKLTDSNLSKFSCMGDDSLTSEYENYTFENVSYEVKNGEYVAKFVIRAKTSEEIRMDALEEGQNIQNGAIEELAGLVGGE